MHAATIGESLYGAAIGYTDVLVVAIGTGIGGASCTTANSSADHTGSAGAIGHLPVAGVRRVDARAAAKVTCRRMPQGLRSQAQYFEATGIRDSLPTVAAKARAGDEVALSVIVEAAEIQVGHWRGRDRS